MCLSLVLFVRIIKQAQKKSSLQNNKFCFFICFFPDSDIIRSMKRKTIRSHKDFFTTPEDFRSRGYFVTVKAKPAKIPNEGRYGLVASKRVFKLAVDRNRAKRLMRDWLAFGEALMVPCLDYILIAHLPILNCNREFGRKKMIRSLKRIARLHKKNAQSLQ